MSDMSKEMNKARRRVHQMMGESAYHIEVFGDALAKREGYQQLEGMEAIYYYLILKHHWLPSQVKSLSHEDLVLLLAEEMSGWTVPKDAIFKD
jgi:hypothetical protein